jgi:hypothetical protein
VIRTPLTSLMYNCPASQSRRDTQLTSGAALIDVDAINALMRHKTPNRGRMMGYLLAWKT